MNKSTKSMSAFKTSNRVENIKTALILLQMFLFKRTSLWNKKWTKQHKTFCKIHDAIIIGLALVACYCFLAGVGTLEQSDAAGADFWTDVFISLKYLVTSVIIIVVVGDANNLFYDEYDDEEDEF